MRSYEIRIILELCDLGSLRSFLDSKAFEPLGENPNTLAIVDTAIDVARAMWHLHSNQIIHGDLKSLNILLKRSASDPRGFVAKVSDFVSPLDLDLESIPLILMKHSPLLSLGLESAD